MKRTIKILTAALIVATVFGMVAILTSANEVSGVHVTESASFESLDPTFTFDSSIDKSISVEGYSFTISKRSGNVNVGISEDTSENPNQYILIHNAPKVNEDGPYWGTGYGGVNTSNLNGEATRPTISEQGELELRGTDITNWPYLIMDFDVMSPTAKWAANVSLQMRALLSNDDTKIDNISPGDSVSNPIVFATDSTGCYVSDKSGTYKKYVNPFEFTHLTLIVEAVTDETLRSANIYVYLNGEFFAH